MEGRGEVGFGILTNKDVIAIDQDPEGKAASRVGKHGIAEVWARPLHGGGRAVAFYNRGDSPAHSVNILRVKP